jgi:hypothetical protein
MSIPVIVNDDEELGRNVFSPYHISKDNKIKPAAFRPPPDSRETSIQRIPYCTLEICHEIGKSIASRRVNTYYKGIAIIKAKVIRDNKTEVVSSPIKDENGNIINESHADIIFNYIFEKSKAPPSEILTILKNISNSSFFISHIEQQ